MTTSFHKHWWATHRMDDPLDHGTVLPERAASVGTFSCGTPGLRASRGGDNRCTEVYSTYYKKNIQYF